MEANQHIYFEKMSLTNIQFKRMNIVMAFFYFPIVLKQK